MITAKILNSAATLNNFKELNTLFFIPGSEVKLVLRLWDSQLDLRRVPPATAIVTADFTNRDLTTLSKVLVPLADDRSILTTTLEESETLNLISGRFTITEDTLGDTTSILLGFVNSGLTLQILGDC